MIEKVVYGLFIALLCGWEVAGAQQRLPVPVPLRFTFYDERAWRGPGSPRLVLALQSERKYGSLQYRLHATTSIEDSVILVDVKNVINDSDYQQRAIGPAGYSTYIDLKPGTYRLKIRVGRAVDEYRVDVGAQVIEVLGSSGTITIPPAPVYRLPPRAVYLHCSHPWFSRGSCEDVIKLFGARTGTTLSPELDPVTRNPFRQPFPQAGVGDSSPQGIFTDVPEEEFVEGLELVRSFTELFQAAPYHAVVVIWRANAPGYTCHAGTCLKHRY